MSTLIVYGGTTSARCEGRNDVYLTARSTFAEVYHSDVVSYMFYQPVALTAGQWFNNYRTAYDYTTYQSFLQFDTSAIPDTAIVDSAVLSMYYDMSLYGADPDAGYYYNPVSHVVEARIKDWGTDVTSADWVPGASMSGLTKVATHSFVANTYYYPGPKVFTSEAAFAANINRTGITYLILCSDRQAAGTVPTSWGAEISSFQSGKAPLYSTDNVYPKLVVTYHMPGVPSVTTTDVTSIAETAALSGGNVTSDGGAAVTARGVCWNTHDSPTIVNTHTTDGSGTGTFTSTLTGLAYNRKYYVRAYATNNVGTDYGAEFSFCTPAYTAASLGRSTCWGYALSDEDVLTDLVATSEYAGHSLAKGTVVLGGIVKNRRGALIPAKHVRAGWWIQHLETGSGRPLYITGHSVDLAAGKNAITVGEDWMEKEIGVREAELLAFPASAVEAQAIEAPTAPEEDAPAAAGGTATPAQKTAVYEFDRSGAGAITGRAAPEGYVWMTAGSAREPGGEWISQGEVLVPAGMTWAESQKR